MALIDRDTLLLKIIDILDFATNMCGYLNVEYVELQPQLLQENTFISGIKIIDGQPMVHIKQYKHIETVNGKTLFLANNPEMDLWINATLMDPELMKQGLNKLMQQLQKTEELHLLILTFENSKIMQLSIFQDKRLACKYAIETRKKFTCTFKFVSINKQQTNKISDLEFATAPLTK